MNVWSTDKIDYFLKLRFGDFCGPSVLIPDHLKQIGVKNIILSIATQTEELGPTVQSQSFQHIIYCVMLICMAGICISLLEIP